MAFPVMQRAQAAIDRFNREMRRSSFVKTELIRRDAGDFTVRMTFNDEVSELLKLELMAPTQKQAHRLATAFSEKAEVIYKVIMDQLLAKPKDKT